MKNLLLLLILLTMVNVKAKEENSYDARGLSIRERLELMKQIKAENSAKNNLPQQKAEEMFSSLKSEGLTAIEDISKDSMLDSATNRFVEQEMGKKMNKTGGLSDIKSAMSQKDGEIEEYRKIGEDQVMLNGSYYKTTYLIEYKNGRTQTVELLFIKPTISGEYKLMELNVE